MKVTLQVELKPFITPDFVWPASGPGWRQDGMQELTGYPLSALDAQTLDKMCAQFRAEVFEKAGKEPPPVAGWHP